MNIPTHTYIYIHTVVTKYREICLVGDQ